MRNTPKDALKQMHPAVATWFRTALGEPTAPQIQAWPLIANGENTLICAPTGSGKTLAAFLACLNLLWKQTERAPGVQIVYISPLKSLNNDIARNLESPLAGVVAAATRLGRRLRDLSVGVRTGDTPQAERLRQLKKPPEILITTPESLHLMLTSGARKNFKTVTHVIVDEIHALCGDKRGVFLAILLERLAELSVRDREFVRIGLSATQRPLEEVARYLGGLRVERSENGEERFVPRDVKIVDAGMKKRLDLSVHYPIPELFPAKSESVWPAIEERLLREIAAHKSTIVFVNNRRVVERLTRRLNELAEDRALEDQRQRIDLNDHQTEFLSQNINSEARESRTGSVNTGDDAFFGDGVEAADEAATIARAHHGSLSLDERRGVEESLKRGSIPAVVATASLELGIDMGSVELVCQVESPGSVSRGLQRVGRAGHIVGMASKGRLIAKTPADLLESAALAWAMRRGEVERLKIPVNCLDILAQQVVACVAVESWNVTELYKLIRRVYSYRDLTADAFESVVRMVAGRYPTPPIHDLRARIHWDRLENTLHALPGTARTAIVGGGAIADTGQFPVYVGDGGPRIGELDEEFVYERRIGESFLLGTATWRIEAIEPHRVLVARDEGSAANVPFWHGERAMRTIELGEAVGALSRTIQNEKDDDKITQILMDQCAVDRRSAELLISYHRRQEIRAGAAPNDQTVLIESFIDPTGDLGTAILTPFGGKLHQALKMCIQGVMRRRLGILVSCLHGADGILVRLPNVDEPPLDVLEGLTAEIAESLIRGELAETALFGLRFRQNAFRALLTSRSDPGKRTPLWLQRLRAKDLLQIARKFADFPIFVETYRECLEQDLDIPRLRVFLDAISSGAIKVIKRIAEVPSPFTSSLVFQFQAQYMYQWDEPRPADRRSGSDEFDRDRLDSLLANSALADRLDPRGVGAVEGRLRGEGRVPRTADELVELLLRAGDMTREEIPVEILPLLDSLIDQKRAARIDLEGTVDRVRWIAEEDRQLYQKAFGYERDFAATIEIVRRFTQNHLFVGIDVLTSRYPLDIATARGLLEKLTLEGSLARVDGGRWGDRANLAEAERVSAAIRRRDRAAVRPEAFVDFIARRQGIHPASKLAGVDALERVIERLEGFAVTAELWEGEILPRRIADYRPAALDRLLALGGLNWRSAGSLDLDREPRVAFLSRDFAGGFPEAIDRSEEASTDQTLEANDTLVLEYISKKGASFLDEIAAGTRLRPSATARSLCRLLRLGRVTNDLFDPLRPGYWSAYADEFERVGEGSARRESSRSARSSRPAGAARRRTNMRPQGRWYLHFSYVRARENPNLSSDETTASLEAWAWAMFDRYGVLAREIAEIEPWAPPWRELVPVLTRIEWRGEIERGYFVEGLSGVQFATKDAAEALASYGDRNPSDATPYLLSSLDPANLYGSAAPFDVDFYSDTSTRLIRNAGSHVVIAAGRPILAIEGRGKRVRSLPTATADELAGSIALLSSLAGPRRRILRVETFNGVDAIAEPWGGLLAAAGFVRDPPGMAYYAGW